MFLHKSLSPKLFHKHKSWMDSFHWCFNSAKVCLGLERAKSNIQSSTLKHTQHLPHPAVLAQMVLLLWGTSDYKVPSRPQKEPFRILCWCFCCFHYFSALKLEGNLFWNFIFNFMHLKSYLFGGGTVVHVCTPRSSGEEESGRWNVKASMG
jgi:hypothetical protein